MRVVSGKGESTVLFFEYGLILLIAILISNIINRFLPVLSVPIIQIALGVIIALLPIEFTLELNPELFLIVFIVPLLFNDGIIADRKTLWKLKNHIILLAFGLVLLTVLVIGYLVHFLTPSIPLAAAFALAAALAPIDAVAVGALGKRIKIPHTIMGLLEGESLINDASGLVSFQFATAAMVTGTFSLMWAGIELVVISVGGVVVGLLFTHLKVRFVRWLRSLGMENVTLHILIEILTPFLVYILAEYCKVSGILAVVASGIMHSFDREKINPETVRLNTASTSVWSTLVFVLNGLVFILLGTQLPATVETMWIVPLISKLKIVAYIIIITLVLMLIRFLWSLFTIKKDTYKSESHLSKTKASLIISMSGVRGAVTLATTMSIPLLLGNGNRFPERDLIILLASGVIMCSLLIVNFILPLFLEKEIKTDISVVETEACIEIVNNVIAELNNQVTEKNRRAVSRVIRDYYQRKSTLQRKQNGNPFDIGEEISLKKMIYDWERQNTNALLCNNEIDEVTAERYLGILDRQEDNLSLNEKNPFKVAMKSINFAKYIKRFGSKEQDLKASKKQFYDLYRTNDTFVLQKLKQLHETDDRPLINKYISDYEFSLSIQNSKDASHEANNEEAASVESIAALGFQLERDNIQTMFESGRISWETAGQMRRNISLLELQIKKDYF